MCSLAINPRLPCVSLHTLTKASLFLVCCIHPQVLITPHSAFLTAEALGNIADTTAENLVCACLGRPLANEVLA